MITVNGQQYRNLEEQVLKNEDDIAILKASKNISDLGIKIIQPEALPSVESLPSDYEGQFGDAYLVGTQPPYSLYIWTRSNQPAITGYWFDYGPLNAPSVVPGPIGPQGIQGKQGDRGSFWYSQTGAPTITENVRDNDQALNGSTGDVYQFVNGTWQKTGNIRGPQGIQGIQGIVGPAGPIGPQGPVGPKGDQGQFIQIVGTLPSISQLPDPTTVPRYSAYLIPVGGVEHVYLIIGENTSASPLLWHDAGGFESGTQIYINGAKQSQLDFSNDPTIPSYATTDGTSATIDSTKATVKFNNLQVTGNNVSGSAITPAQATIELPIHASNNIAPEIDGNGIRFQLTPNYFKTFEDRLSTVAAQEVNIDAPTTATQGQLTEDQLNTLLTNRMSYILFNEEVYRQQDDVHGDGGYLVYTHVGFNNTTASYIIKCITITTSTLGWVLTTMPVKRLYEHKLVVTSNNLTAVGTLINDKSSAYTASSIVSLLATKGSIPVSGVRVTGGTGTYIQIAEALVFYQGSPALRMVNIDTQSTSNVTTTVTGSLVDSVTAL